MYSLDDKMRLVTGNGMWHTDDLGGRVDRVWMSDGPHGLRAQDEKTKTNNKSIEATCFPTASALAASWDTELVARVAEGIAEEAKAEGVSILLGPGVNMKRSPLCGRNFEYFSEDPYLAGKLASSYIKAVEAKGIGTSIKHFAGNSQETHRMRENNQIDERTLNEIYLRAFEIAVKEAKPASIMAAYNRINGRYACMNSELLKDILRDRWGYEGLVVSDWGACLNLPQCVKSGMDLEMPDSYGAHLRRLKRAYKNGKITSAEIDRAAQRVLQTVEKYGSKHSSKMEAADKRELLKKHHLLAVKTAEECAVLLKNDGLLPLNPKGKYLVIGDLAKKVRFQGGGSSHINTSSCVNFLDVLKQKDIRYIYERGYDSGQHKTVNKLRDRALAMAREHDLPILFFGGLTDLAEGEGYDRTELQMPDNQIELLREIQKLNRDVIFVSFGGSPYDLEPAMYSKAILHMYLAGEGSAEAAAALIFGECNPSGKLAETFPLTLSDTPAYGNFGAVGDDICYTEGLFIGYRYYDSMRVPVRYPFGYGLSYTNFEYSDLSVEAGEKVKVRFNIKNTGDREGMESVQIYVKNPMGKLMRPVKELRAFTKVKLNKGESKSVEVELDDNAFAIFDTESHSFRNVKGDYEILVGASSQDIRLRTAVRLSADDAIENEGPVTLPHIMTIPEFTKVYGKPLSNYSETLPGHYNLSNSIRQLAEYSFTGKVLKAFAGIALKVLYFGKNKQDPEVRMVAETILDGPIDVIVCQSRGAIKMSIAEHAVRTANKNSKKKAK